MLGISKHGFSLIEIVVAIAIIGIMATFVIPRFSARGTRPVDVWARNVVSLHEFAYERALLTNKVHKLYFSFKEDVPTMVVQQATNETKSTGETVFTDVTGEYITARYQWDPKISLRNFFIKDIDEARGGTMRDGWYFITPQGTSQSVIITAQDAATETVRSLVVNPFTGGIVIYDTPQTP